MKQLKQATAADVVLLNTIEPPQRGINVGGGLHVEIPSDWAERIAAGEDVPGCTYAKIQADGSLLVSDSAQAELAKQGRDATGIRARLVAVEVAAEETVRGEDVSNYRKELRDILAEVSEKLSGIESKIEAVQTVVVETADDLSTLRSRMIEQASRHDEEQIRQQRATQELAVRLAKLELS